MARIPKEQINHRETGLRAPLPLSTQPTRHSGIGIGIASGQPHHHHAKKQKMKGLLSNAVYTAHYPLHKTHSAWWAFLESAGELANEISSVACGKICNNIAPPIIGTFLGVSLAVLLTASVLRLGLGLIRWAIGRKNSERVFYLNGLSAVSRCESDKHQSTSTKKPERIPYASFQPKSSILSTIEEKSKASSTSSPVSEPLQSSVSAVGESSKPTSFTSQPQPQSSSTSTSKSSSSSTSSSSFKSFRNKKTFAMKTLSTSVEKASTTSNYYGNGESSVKTHFGASVAAAQPKRARVSFAPMDIPPIQPSLSSSTAETEATSASSESSSDNKEEKESASPSLFEWIASSVSGVASSSKHRPRIGKKEGIECFLFYETDSSGRLIQQYLQDEDPPETSQENMVLAWRPKAHVPNHKIRQHGGRRVLIGNCSVGFQGRHNYCNGVCQFIKDAIRCGGGYLMVSGAVGSSSSKMLSVSVYLYLKDNRPSHQTLALKPGTVYEIPNNVLAVACLFQTSNSFYCNMTVDMFQWLADGERNGSSTRI